MDVGRERLLNYQSWDAWIADWLHSESAASRVEKAERKVRPAQLSEPPAEKSECNSRSTLSRTTSGAFGPRRRRWLSRSVSSSSSSASSGNGLTDTLENTNVEKPPKKPVRGDISVDSSTKSTTKPRVTKKKTEPLNTTTEKNRRPNSKLRRPSSSLNLSESRPLVTKRVRPSGDVRAKVQQRAPALPYSIVRRTRKLPTKSDQISDSGGVSRKRESSRSRRTSSSLGTRTRTRSRSRTTTVTKRLTTQSSRESPPPDAEVRSAVPRPRMRLLHEAKEAPKGTELTPSDTEIPSNEHQAKKPAKQKKPSYPRSQVPAETGRKSTNQPILDTWDELKRLKEAQESRSYSVLKKISDELEAFRRHPLNSKLDNVSNAMEDKIFQKNAHPANLAWQKKAPRRLSAARTHSRCESKRRLRRLEEEREKMERHREFMRKAGIKVIRADTARDSNSLNPWSNGNNYTSSTDSGPFLRLSELRSTSDPADDDGKTLPTLEIPTLQSALTSELTTALTEAPTETTTKVNPPKEPPAAGGEAKKAEELTLNLPPSGTCTPMSTPKTKSPPSESPQPSSSSFKRGKRKVKAVAESKSSPKKRDEKVTGAGETSGSSGGTKKKKKAKDKGRKGKGKTTGGGGSGGCKKGKKEGGRGKKKGKAAGASKGGKVAGGKAKSEKDSAAGGGGEKAKKAAAKNQSNTNGLDERLSSSFTTASTEQANDHTLKAVPDLEAYMVASEEAEIERDNPFASSASSPSSAPSSSTSSRQQHIAFDSKTLNLLETALCRQPRSTLTSLRKRPQKVYPTWQQQSKKNLNASGASSGPRPRSIPRRLFVGSGGGTNSVSSSLSRKFGERASSSVAAAARSGSRGRFHAVAVGVAPQGSQNPGVGVSWPKPKPASGLAEAKKLIAATTTAPSRQTNNASAETARLLQKLQLRHLSTILGADGLLGGGKSSSSREHDCLRTARLWRSGNNAVDAQSREEAVEEQEEGEETYEEEEEGKGVVEEEKHYQGQENEGELKQPEAKVMTTPAGGEDRTAFRAFHHDNNSSGDEADDDDDSDKKRENARQEAYEELSFEEDSNADTDVDFSSECKELQLYVTITSSEIDDIALPFRASNAMHRALAEAYKMYVESRARERAFFTLGGERRHESLSPRMSPWPDRATKRPLAPMVNVFRLVQRCLKKATARRKKRRRPRSPRQQYSRNNSQSRRSRRVLKQTYRPLRLSSRHPLRRVLQYLSSQQDRRIFAIENQIDGRMLLDEDRVYFVHGLPCLLLRVMAPSFADIRRGLTMLEESMPRLYTRLLVADRLPIMQGTRAPTKNNFTKCGWYQNRIKESAFVASMHYFGITEAGFRVNEARWGCPGKRCKDVELYAQGDPAFATDLCLIQSRDLLFTRWNQFIF